MGRFDDHCHPLWLKVLPDCVRHLGRQSLLDLQPAGIHLDDARDLREADHPAARNVGDRGLAEERQQVVLAQ